MYLYIYKRNFSGLKLINVALWLLKQVTEIKEEATINIVCQETERIDKLFKEENWKDLLSLAGIVIPNLQNLASQSQGTNANADICIMLEKVMQNKIGWHLDFSIFYLGKIHIYFRYFFQFIHVNDQVQQMKDTAKDKNHAEVEKIQTRFGNVYIIDGRHSLPV